MEQCPLCAFTSPSFRGIGLHLSRVHGEAGHFARFMRFVEEDEGCLLWRGQINPSGYGKFATGGGVMVAHRWHYQFRNGELNADVVLDHLCRRRSCVALEHLEPVSQRENLRRSANHVGRHMAKNACDNGHVYTVGTTRLVVQRNGHVERVCKPCKAEWVARRRATKRGAA